MVVTFTVSLTPGDLAPVETSTTCGQPADVIFLIDSSNSIWIRDFKRYVIPFMKNVSAQFNVGPGPRHTRIGALSFSHVIRKQFGLKSYSDKERLMAAFDRIKLIGGQTRTDKALRYATKRMLRPSDGARPDVPHILIVLTDGQSSFPDKTAHKAELARRKGATVFAIGVSAQTSDSELAAIASTPASRYKFKVTDFSGLDRIMMDLAIKACQVMSTTTQPPPTTTTTTPEPTTTTMDPMNDCGGKEADILFVLDSSTSIDRDDFNKRVLGFIRDVIKSLSIGQDKARVGVMTFSDEPHLLIRFTDFARKAPLMSAVTPSLLSYTPGGTRTADALRHVRVNGFGSTHRRRNAARLAIVITDGQSWDEEETKAQAQSLRDDDVMVYAIGVGSAVRKEELEAIANSPSEDFVFSVDDFSALYQLKDVLGTKTCAWEVDERMSNEQPMCGDGPIEMTFAFDAGSMDNPSKRQALDNLQMVNKRLMSLGGDVKIEVTSGPCPPSLDVEMSRPHNISKHLRNVRNSVRSRLHAVVRDWRDRHNARAESVSPHDGKPHKAEYLPGGVTRALVLVVTGENTAELDLITQEVSWLRSRGVHVLVVLHESVGKYPADTFAEVLGPRHVVAGVKPSQDYSGYLTEVLCSLRR